MAAVPKPISGCGPRAPDLISASTAETCGPAPGCPGRHGKGCARGELRIRRCILDGKNRLPLLRRSTPEAGASFNIPRLTPTRFFFNVPDLWCGGCPPGNAGVPPAPFPARPCPLRHTDRPGTAPWIRVGLAIAVHAKGPVACLQRPADAPQPPARHKDAGGTPALPGGRPRGGLCRSEWRRLMRWGDGRRAAGLRPPSVLEFWSVRTETGGR